MKLPALLICLAMSTAVVAQIAAVEPVSELDRVVAIVNDDVIVASELSARIRTVRSQLYQAGTQPPPLPVLRRQVLERLVLEHLQLDIAEKTGVRVDDATLNRAVRDIAAKNGLALGEFRDILERDGYSFPKFREDIRNEILISRVQQRQVDNRINVTDREVENFLATRKQQGDVDNEYRLGHILIAVPEAASPEQIAAAERRADEILERLRSGVDFAQTAVAVSDGQQALQGGDLGWRKAAQLPTLFSDTVPEMNPGDVDGPIRSPSGFHIIKLLEMRGNQRHIITQTKARHILIRTDELTPDSEAQTRLRQLKIRIENGEKFGELARSHSDDTATASKGGDLGWLSPGDVVPRFEEVMNGLNAGQISDPFQTRYGWHVAQVVSRREYDGTREVERSRAREQIRQRKTEEELQSWMRQIRDEAYVEFRLEGY